MSRDASEHEGTHALGAAGSGWPGGERTRISIMVLRMLDADVAPDPELDTRTHPAHTLRGAVAQEVHARGLAAELEVYEDRECYDASAEVVITNPAKPERGLVRINDDGMISWECDYHDIPKGAVAIADTVADVVACPTVAAK